MTVEAVLGARRGMIVAPAGCGKTHLIANVLRVKPVNRYLVLTHTTAGVTALKKRLTSLAVPGSHYVVTTLDGWAVRVATSFPGLCPTDVPPESGSPYYNSLRQHILTLLRAGNITDIIQASYSRLLVDEYQDCNTVQHELVDALAEILPTVTFGDPLQCIFSFSGPMPDWVNEVMIRFPPLGTLRTPWRWNNARTPALGEWLLACRSALHSGQAIRLDSCPAHVTFRQLTGVPANDLQMQQQEFYRLVRQDEGGSVLILGNSRRPDTRHKFALRLNGLDVLEPVELGDVIRIARSLDNVEDANLVSMLLTSAGELITNVEATSTLSRMSSIQAGRNRTPPSPVEAALMNLSGAPTRTALLAALCAIEEKPGVKVYRRGAFRALKDTLSLSVSAPGRSLADCAASIREQRRYRGDQRIPLRAIGSTLLLKGLECDHAIILDADSMSANDLYVALSRGAKSVTVFSRSALYQPPVA